MQVKNSRSQLALTTSNWHSTQLDPERLVRLLRHNTGNRNRRRIALALYVIASNVAKCFRFADDRAEDAAAEALVLAISQIDSFDCRRRHAAGYFARMMKNKMYEILLADNDALGRRHKPKRLRMQSLDAIGGPRLAA